MKETRYLIGIFAVISILLVSGCIGETSPDESGNGADAITGEAGGVFEESISDEDVTSSSNEINETKDDEAGNETLNLKAVSWDIEPRVGKDTVNMIIKNVGLEKLTKIEVRAVDKTRTEIEAAIGESMFIALRPERTELEPGETITATGRLEMEVDDEGQPYNNKLSLSYYIVGKPNRVFVAQEISGETKWVTEPDLEIVKLFIPLMSEKTTSNLLVDVNNKGWPILDKYLVSMYAKLIGNSEDWEKIGPKDVEFHEGKSQQSLSFDWTPQTTGDYTLKIVLDEENKIAESDEENNEYEMTFTVVSEDAYLSKKASLSFSSETVVLRRERFFIPLRVLDNGYRIEIYSISEKEDIEIVDIAVTPRQTEGSQQTREFKIGDLWDPFDGKAVIYLHSIEINRGYVKYYRDRPVYYGVPAIADVSLKILTNDGKEINVNESFYSYIEGEGRYTIKLVDLGTGFQNVPAALIEVTSPHGGRETQIINQGETAVFFDGEQLVRFN